MCTTVVIGDKEIGSMDELAAVLGGREMVRFHRGYPNRSDDFWRCCLCPVNVERTARENGYHSRRDKHDSMRSHWRKRTVT